MEIEFENIGFIKKGKIETNNITIIFGPNNVGKTYLSYSVFAATSKYNEIIKSKIKVPKDVSTRLVADGTAAFSLIDILNDRTLDEVKTELSNLLPEFFKNNTGLFKNSKLNVIDNTLKNQLLEAEVKFDVSVREHILLSIEKKRNENFITFGISYVTKENKVTLKEKEANDYINSLFTFFFINQVTDLATNNAFIITSERTGISLFQKEIDGNRSNLVNKMLWNNNFESTKASHSILSFEDLLSKRVAKFSEPINHNINIIRDFSNLKKSRGIGHSIKKNKVYEKILQTLESLTKGRYSTVDDETLYTVTNSDGKDITIPLSLSSASNKALFLFDIYIRNYISPNSYLIIDEPELNLHPKNQIKMAELLVRLSRYGVKIIITTHSDYIVKEINNRIMASKINDIELMKYLAYEKQDLISQSEVNAFTIGEDGIITEVGNNEYGVNAYLFDNVISDIESKTSALYEYFDERK